MVKFNNKLGGNKMKCRQIDCSHDNNGWCKLLKTNNKNEKLKCPHNQGDSRKHLEWIYGRMIEVHSENKNFDYMQKFREIIDSL